jgi:hypothetical protein
LTNNSAFSYIRTGRGSAEYETVAQKYKAQTQALQAGLAAERAKSAAAVGVGMAVVAVQGRAVLGYSHAVVLATLAAEPRPVAVTFAEARAGAGAGWAAAADHAGAGQLHGSSSSEEEGGEEEEEEEGGEEQRPRWSAQQLEGAHWEVRREMSWLRGQAASALGLSRLISPTVMTGDGLALVDGELWKVRRGITRFNL